MDITAIAAKARDKAIARIADEEIAAQQGSGLLTPDMARQKVAGEVDKTVEELGGRVAEGLRVLQAQYAKVKSASRPDTSIALLEPGFFAGKEASLATHADRDDEDMDLRDALGVSLDDLSAAHDLAAELLDEGRNEDAAAALFCLANLAPEVPELSLSLAHAEYHCGRLESAAQCYALSYVCDPANPRPLVHAAFCLVKMGNRAEALDYLEQAEQVNQEAGDEQVAKDIQQLRREAP